MRPVKDMPVVSFNDFEVMLEAILDDLQLVNFIKHRKLDLGYSFLNARFRVNLFHDIHGGNAVYRVIPFKHLSFADIELPMSGRRMADRPKGIILVTGATGAGKSTTLSTFITHVNTTYHKTIALTALLLRKVFAVPCRWTVTCLWSASCATPTR
jgi:twitching motility protein PilT